MRRVSFFQDFFSPGSRSSQISPLFSCLFDTSFHTFPWMYIFIQGGCFLLFFMLQEHVKKPFFHSSFLHISWKHYCAEVKVGSWEVCGSNVVIFFWRSNPVMFDKSFSSKIFKPLINLCVDTRTHIFTCVIFYIVAKGKCL